MGIFPENLTLIDTESIANQSIDYGREWAFDFDKNKFIMKNGTPMIVTGIEALKIFIIKTIKTARYRYLIHSWEYGCEIEDVLGQTLERDVIESIIKSMITEALIYDARIKSISDFEIVTEESEAKIKFKVLTNLEDELEVITNV